MSVPPTAASTLIFVYSLNICKNLAWDKLNSLVGVSISTWVLYDYWSTLWSVPTPYAAVFPVPACACPIISLPETIGSTALLWIIDGF